MGTDLLKEQYNQLMENQKLKIKRLKDKQAKMTKQQNENDSIFNDPFQIDEELNYDNFEDSTKAYNANSSKSQLKTQTIDSSEDDLDLNIVQTKKSSVKRTAETNETRESLSASERLRQFKDESGRFRKLLAEKEYEINFLRKKLEDEKLAFTGGAIGSDAIATKIVDLSKRVRELNAELESERTKNKQMAKQNQDLKYKLENKSKGEIIDANKYDNGDDDESSGKLAKENKELKDKLNSSNAKLMEFKSQCEIFKQDLKKMQRVLEKEIGENVDVKTILNGQVGWRGRQQQINSLQNKVNELKQQISMNEGRTVSCFDEDPDMTAYLNPIDGYRSAGQFSVGSVMTSKKQILDAKHKFDLKRMEKDKKDQVEKIKKEYEALDGDYNTLKSKSDALKARNNMLSNELKINKEQLKTLLEKGKHDDELIEALLQKQSQLKKVVEDLSAKTEMAAKDIDETAKEAQVKSMQDKNLIDQLKSIISEKEKKLKVLEDEIEVMRVREQSNQNLHFILSKGNTNQTVEHNEQSKVKNQIDEDLQRNNYNRAEMNHIKTNTKNDRDVLQPKNTSARGTKIISRPSSSANNKQDVAANARKDYDELKIEYHELKTLRKSLEVERDRLIELVRLLQSRLEEMNEKLVESDNKYNEQRRRCVNLEKQLEKLKLDGNNSNPKQNNTSRQKPGTTAIMDQYKIEELETSLLIQKDENDALKAALKSTLEAKEEDLRLYVEMLESTKQVFLDGLKEFKQLTR